MSFLDLFKKTKKTFQEEQDFTKQKLGNEIVDSSKGTTITINYGSGMPIDIIYVFLKQDNEARGYEDALINPDVSYNDMNKAMLSSKLEVKFSFIRATKI